MSIKAAVGFRYTPTLLVVVGVLIVTEYAFVYVDAPTGIMLSLFSLLAIYSLISVLKVSEHLSETLENISLLFIYVMLVSALPWFYLKQDLLTPAIYSMILTLCFWRIHSRNLSFESLGFVKRGLGMYSIIGIVAGIPLGTVEYFILRPQAATPTFSITYFLQTTMYMIFFVALGEEVLFRSLIQKSLVNMMGDKQGIFWGAVIFGVMHFVWRSVPELFFTFGAGLVLGFYYYRTKSLAGSIVLHAVNNILLLAILPYLF